VDGGRVAAYGFRYQYWRTLETLLDVIDDDLAAAVRVEGPPSDSSGDAVDFDVIGTDGQCLVAVQVKARVHGGSMSGGEAFGVIARLIGHEASAYEVQTNARSTPSAEALDQVFAGGGEPTRIRDQLAEILATSPARLTQLRGMKPQQVQRLSRCRVRFDERGDDEIRDALRERLRDYRNRAHQGLGQRSAGLLSGYLMSEILDRAADEAGATFTIQQLRSHLVVSGEDMARAVGARDWGVLVGPMPPVPDVDRPSLLQALRDTLNKQRSDNVRRVALLGPSGIGKSSLAAAYIADQADAYDCVFWADGESEAALTASFRRVLTFLRPRNQTPADLATAAQLRDEVHTELSRLAGRWAIVLDNVVDHRLADRWIPRLGRGDVIITSIDSVGPHRGLAVDVNAMRESEAVELLRRRLRVDDEDADSQAASMSRLARELSYWPLAMELAAGYMDTCGIPLGDLDRYIGQLKVRALMDEASLPAAYPRTLAAAIFLCLDELGRRIEAAGDSDIRPYFALATVTYGAYLASRQLPIHLTLAATVHDPSPEEGLGPYFLDPSYVNAGEVVRELRRFSLISFDDNLPATGLEDRLPDADRTVTVNAVVQDLVRARYDQAPATHETLNRLANHVERWLMPALELNLLERTALLSNHAEALARHLHRLNVHGDRIPLFYGNLAGAYRARGDLDRAEELLRAELALLGQATDATQIVVVQAKLSLVGIMIDKPQPTSDVYQEAAGHLTDVLQYAATIRTEHPEAAVKLAIHGTGLVRHEAAGSPPELAGIAAELDDLLSSLSPTAYSKAVDAALRADALLRAGGSGEEAADLCREALQSGCLTGPIELSTMRILVESLVDQRDWYAASREHARLRRLFGSTGFYRSFVAGFVHDVGAMCAVMALFDSDQAASELLADVMDWPVEPDACAPNRYARIRVLAAVRDCARGDYQTASTTLDAVRPDDVQGGPEHETQLWCRIWQLCRLAIFRQAWPHLGQAG